MFDEDAKEVWNKAKSRVFDIGFEYTGGDIATNDQLNYDVLRRVVDLKASIAFTYYPPPCEEEQKFTIHCENP